MAKCAKSLTKKNVCPRSTIKSRGEQGGKISHQIEVTQLSPSYYSQLEGGSCTMVKLQQILPGPCPCPSTQLLAKSLLLQIQEARFDSG